MKSKLAIFAIIAALATQTLSAQTSPVAFLGVSNASGDPRYDYLSGILAGITGYDLSQSLSLVERVKLDKALREQEFSASSLQADSASKMGKLIGADWVLSGEFSLVGPEVQFVCTLIHVETARSFTFRERGADENVAHRVAEQITRKLTGDSPKFADPASRRSILSLRDETPGSITLYTPLLDAEIFIDGKFSGYSQGNGKVPFVIAKVSPGLHRVRTRLSRDFGVVKLPEITFSDWDEEVTVESGGNVVVRDLSRHFSDWMWKIMHVDAIEKKLPLADWKTLATEKTITYTDRIGVSVTSTFTAVPAFSADVLSLSYVLESRGKKAVGTLIASVKAAEQAEAVARAGDLEANVKLVFENGRWRFQTTFVRTDVSDDEWRKRD